MPQIQNPIDTQTLLGFEKAFSKKRILVTGHTGFTGGWLCLWLSMLGADVYGLSLKPNTQPNLHDTLGIDKLVNSSIGNINNLDDVEKAFAIAMPEMVFHLAAQPLVKRAYDDPLESFMTNVMGTANILETSRNTAETKAVVCVTTDKVYKDKNWSKGYCETDELGGKDPYSASKSAAEMVAYAYQSTLSARANNVAVGIARGGNIIGGGDWSDDRIVPDFVRAKTNKIPLVLRNPKAVRPWQHVISLCHGYLVLADALLNNGSESTEAFNFGPAKSDIKTVGELVETLSTHWPGAELQFEKGSFLETHFLAVDSTKSNSVLNWQPPIGFEDTIAMTANWYKTFNETPETIFDLSLQHINHYRNALS